MAWGRARALNVEPGLGVTATTLAGFDCVGVRWHSRQTDTHACGIPRSLRARATPACDDLQLKVGLDRRKGAGPAQLLVAATGRP